MVVFRKRPASEEERGDSSPKRVAAEGSGGGGPVPVAAEPGVLAPVVDGPPEPARPVRASVLLSLTLDEA